MQPNAPQGLVGVEELILNCCDFFGAGKDTRIAGSIPGQPSSDSSGFLKEKCFVKFGYLVCKTIMRRTLVLQWELKIKIFFHQLWAFKKFDFMHSKTCFNLQPVLSLIFAWHWFKSWFNQRSKGSNQIFQSGWLEA